MESRGLMAVSKSTVHGLARVLVGFMTVWLVACGGGGGGSNGAPRVVEEPVVAISGRVALVDQSLEGAKISLGRIDVTRSPATQNVKGKVIPLENSDQPPVVDAGGDISFQAPAAAIQDDQLFSVAVTCEPVSERCPYKMPLHAVMSGARLKQGEWTVNVSTEVAYQRLAYYVAARFSEADLKQEMDTTAKLLLKADVDGSGGIDYEDLLQWEPGTDGESSALLRSGEIIKFGGLLKDGADVHSLIRSVEDLTDPMLGHADLPDRGLKIQVSGATGYVISRSSGLQVFDFSSPQEPKSMGSILANQDVRDFVLQDQFLYVATALELYIFDTTNPLQPVMISGGGLRLESDVYKIQVADGFAYLCSGSVGVRIISVKNPAVPVLLDETLEGDCSEIAVGGSNAYVVSVVTGEDISELPSYVMRVFSLGEIGMPEVGRLDGVGYFGSLRISGGYAYFLETIGDNITPMLAKGRLAVVDISNAATPIVIGHLDVPRLQGGVDDIVTNGQGLNVLFGDAVCAVNVSDPRNPMYDACVDVDRDVFGYGVGSFAVSGKYAYLSGVEGVDVVNIASLSAPVVVSHYLQESLTNVVFNEDTLFYVDYVGVLQSIDFSRPLAPVKKAGPQVASWYGGLWSIFDYLYFSSFRASDGSQLKAVSWRGHELSEDVVPVDMPPYFLFDKDYNGHIVYAATSNGFAILDYSVPAAPKILFEDATLPSVNVKYRNGCAYLRLADKLVIFDVADPAAPKLLGSVDVPSVYNSFGMLAIYGQYAFLASGDNGLVVVDISDHENPAVVGNLFENEWIGAIQISGHYAYVAKGDRHVNILDLSVPSKPSLYGSVRTMGHVGGLHMSQRHLYIDSRYGIEILSLLPPN